MLMQMTNATLLNPTPIYPKHLLLRKDIPVIILHHHPSRRTDIRPTVIIAATATGGHATITETIAIGITCTAIVVVALTVNYASTGGSNNSTASINTTVPALAHVTGIANSTVPNHTHSVDAIVPTHAYISCHTHSSGRNDDLSCWLLCSTPSINATVPALADVTGIANSTVPNHTHSVDAFVPIHAYISCHTHSSGRNDVLSCWLLCSTPSINATVPALADVTGIANSTVPNHTHSVDAIVPIHAYISSHTHSSGRNDGSPCRRVCRYDASIYAFPGHWQTFCTRPRFANIIRGSGRVTLSTSPNDSIKNAGVGKLGIIRLQSAIKLFVFSINHKFVKFVIHDEFRFRFFGSLHGLRTRMVGVGARMKRSARLGISFARGQVGENA